MIEELKQAGIVVDSTSDHASPILLVRKKTGELRIGVDYRALVAEDAAFRVTGPIVTAGAASHVRTL
ncbi:hypothetical protein HPB48_006057 [Haemaphysalis longicornis]|uniref:Uncharacterized protein n=1 Tax=Haemaphysalis longicornis TaxID=44386 RepID=A0A9J6GIH1_HAELO|nr:hypothetical protein HPB48_006057 [Haemaphysalis longicornis]